MKRWPEPEVWGQHVGERWGLNYAQFSFDLLDPRCCEEARDSMCEAIKKASCKYGFQIHSAFTGCAAYTYNLLLHPFVELRRDGLQWCELASVAAKKMGAKGVGGALGSASIESMKDMAYRDYLITELVEEMRYFARYAALHNQEFVLWEPTPRPSELTHEIDECLRIYERFNMNVPIPVYFCLDIGHQCGYALKGRELNTYIWLEKLGKYSPVVHIQQTDKEGDRHWPFTKKYNKVGTVNMERVLEAIDKSGLKKVFLILEAMHAYEYEEEKILEELDESFDYLKQFA